jgi:hypothetical protein
MKLLRDFFFLGRLRGPAAARRRAAPRAYTITVPAPVDGGNVVALHRPPADVAAPRRVVPNVGAAIPRLARAANQ